MSCVHWRIVVGTAFLEDTAPARVKGCCLPVAPLLADDHAERVAAVFRVLADPTRVQMLHLLKAATEPLCVCDFTAAFDLGQPTVSHHLAKLKEAGLVSSFRRGVWSFYQLRQEVPALAQAALALIP
jgi:ArsR family transcriptional regulator, arsenate/arsenite/antimonite-responsive transcriptional repressor